MNLATCTLFTATIVAGTTPSVLSQTIVAPVITDSSLAARVGPVASIAAAPASDIASVLGSNLPLWRGGLFALRPHAAYRFAYSDGLLAAPGKPLGTDTQTLSAGSALEIGEHWRADYTGSWIQYSSARLKDGFDQAANASGSYTYVNWTFGLSAAYSATRPMLVEIAGQARQETFGGGVSAHASVGQRSFADLSLSVSDRRAKGLTTAAWLDKRSIRDWSTRDTFGYAWSEKLTLSSGLTLGYAEQAIGPDMTYVRPEFRAQWRPTQKVSVDLVAGTERRQFHNSSAKAFNTPVYSAGATYQPFETTSLTFAATQGVAASYIGEAVTRSQGWMAGVRQRLLQRVYVNASYSQEWSRYHETIATLPRTRSDTYDTVAGSLSVPFFGRAAASVFYSRSHNGSNSRGYGFTTTTYGAEVRFSF